jgi:hypothetical protein
MKSPRKKTWRCFHCDEVFRGRVRAELHFGSTQNAVPLCQISAENVRAMEAELALHRTEDTELHRQISNMQAGHADALRRAEESGYAKGLQDARHLPA